jgi:hypothetical protein
MRNVIWYVQNVQILLEYNDIFRLKLFFRSLRKIKKGLENGVDVDKRIPERTVFESLKIGRDYLS